MPNIFMVLNTRRYCLGYGASENLFMSNDLSEVVEWVKNNPKTKEQLKQTEEECY